MAEDKRRTGHQTLVTYYKKYKGYFIWGFVVLACTNILQAIVPKILGNAVDGLKEANVLIQCLSNAGDSGTIPLPRFAVLAGLDELNSISRWMFLFGSALTIVLISAVAGVFRFFSRRSIIWASRDIEFDLRNELFSHLQTLPASFYQKTPTGDIIARSSNDIEQVRMMIGPGVMYMSNAIFTAITVFPMLVFISWKLTLFALIPLPLLSIAMWRISTMTHKRFMQVQKNFSDLSTFVQESLAGVRVIKAYRREGFQNERFGKVSYEYVTLNLSLARVRALFMPMIMVLVGAIVLTVVWAGGHQVISGAISLGSYIAFMQYLLMLIWPMLAIGFVLSLYQRGMVSLKRIDDILNEQTDITEPEHPEHAKGDGTIRVNQLSFNYPRSNTPVLRDVSFEVKPGEMVAIVGATGSGKSTLVSLLVRTYPVAEGTIYLDEVDITKIPVDELRSQIGYVLQDPYLFSDTVAANIAFSKDEVNMDEVRDVAIKAAFHNEIESFPDQYETILGERGITLSGGQKQRATIARALLKKPKILIFDDAFSSVDTQTEEMILERIAENNGKVTTLLISHRPSTIRRADRIIVLDQGTVVESGTHDELIANQGRYYEIIKRELLASELESLD